MVCYHFTRSTQESLPNSLVQVLGELIWLLGIEWKGFNYLKKLIIMLECLDIAIKNVK